MALSVIPAPSEAAYYVERDNSGCEVLLIRTTGVSNRVPKILAGIEARVNIACHIEERDRDIRMESLTVVSCRLKDRAIKRYFLCTIEFLTSTPCPNPTVSAVAEMVDRMVGSFQQP